MNLSVPEAVWFATALLTYKKFKTGKVENLKDVAFKQSEILKYAKNFTDKNVDSARISQWANGDHHANTYNYLRAVGGERRITAPGEFKGEKEQPTIDPQFAVNVQLNKEIERISVQQVCHFLANDYASFIDLLIHPTIEFEKIIEHLQAYANEKYISPDKVTGTERERYLTIRKSGQEAVSELNKMAKAFEQKHNLHCPSKSKWLTGGADVVRGYLWNQLKCADKFNIPSSISIFADKRNDLDDVRFRISIEIDEKSASPEDYDNHHKLLDEPFKIDDNYCYYVKYKGGRDSYRTDLTREQIKSAWQSGEIVKVQLVYELYYKQIESGQLSNDQIFKKLESAFDYLKTYYDIAIAKGPIQIVLPDPEIGQEGEGEELKKMYPQNMILYGPPGTGKTYNSALYAVAIIENKKLEQLKQEDYSAVLERYALYKNSSQIQFTTFHQSYGYEEFIEGIKPKLNDENSSEIQYEVAPGVFKKFVMNVERQKNYVFIIDEINRGNISKILGELITLIEPTKRLGANEAMTVTLPYSQENFGVPDNVYILGTMNTADRSIALMDTALRRRFQFIEMLPDTKLLANVFVENIDIEKMVETINKRIEVLYDREHTIGHAYFMSLKDDPSITNLARIFENAILPLLQEYFYEDYSKIQLILGDNAKIDEYKFILDKPVQNVFKGNPDIDLPESNYEIQFAAFHEKESYLAIYE